MRDESAFLSHSQPFEHDEDGRAAALAVLSDYGYDVGIVCSMTTVAFSALSWSREQR